jgi:hypothetical protein
MTGKVTYGPRTGIHGKNVIYEKKDIYGDARQQKRPSVNHLLIDDVGPASIAAIVIYGDECFVTTSP